MPKAVWNGAVIAESEKTVPLEGYTYFPEASVNKENLRPSEHHSTCPWKGVASYYDVSVDGKVNKDAAWYYPAPSAAAQRISGHIAFWKGVSVQR